MKMSNADEKAVEKRDARGPWVPPSIKRVCLRPEEAVLGFCKNGGAAAGPVKTGCQTNLGGCMDQGS